METKVIEQMRSFADISSGLIKSFVDETEQFKAENANLVIELEGKKKQLDRLEQLKKFETALTKFQDNADELCYLSGVSSRDEMITKFPVGEKTLKAVREMIAAKIRDFIKNENPEWDPIQNTFKLQLIGFLVKKFKTKLSFLPALSVNDLQKEINDFDFMANRPQLAKELLDYRAEHTLSQKDMASRLGASSASYGRWERGDRAPSLKFIDKIADLLQKTIQDVEALGMTNIPAQKRQNKFLELGRQLESTRKRRNMGIQDAADEIGVFVNTYYYWEKGIARPVHKHLLRIQKFINSKN